MLWLTGVEEWVFGLGESENVEGEKERDVCIWMLGKVLSDVVQCEG